MPTPTAYANLRKRQEDERKVKDAKNEEKWQRQEKELKATYDNIVKALKDYHKQDLDGFAVTVKNVPRIPRVEVYFDGNLFLTFSPDRQWYFCNSVQCEGFSCSHEEKTWMSLKVMQTRPEKEDFKCYFPCCEAELHKPDQFAKAMATMVDEYRSSGWKPKNGKKT